MTLLEYLSHLPLSVAVFLWLRNGLDLYRKHNNMKNLEAIRASILKAIAEGTDEPEDLNKSAEDALAEAVQSYLSASTATASEPAKKAGKAIKDKGIALCHQAQGYSANLRPVSLMMKASLDELTPEQRAALKRLGYVINQGV
jgi:histone H3/H4